MKLFCLLLLCGLAACSGERHGMGWKEIQSPDGKPTFAVAGGDLAECYRTAANLCGGRTYVILERHDEHESLPLRQGKGAQHSLVISCR